MFGWKCQALQLLLWSIIDYYNNWKIEQTELIVHQQFLNKLQMTNNKLILFC